jgi:hypothetical protein
MDAKEAREKASKIEYDKIIKEYQIILESIKHSVFNGEYQTYYYKSISVGVRDKLETLGYTIHERNERNETLVTIEW